MLLNQACACLRPGHTWFLEISFVLDVNIRVYVCAPNGVHDVDLE